MTTKDEQCVGYCDRCVNKVVKGNLFHDIVEVECGVGVPSGYMSEFGKTLYVGGNAGMDIMRCAKFNSGTHTGANAVIFKDKIVCSRGVKRKIKAFDFYEGDWRV